MSTKTIKTVAATASIALAMTATACTSEKAQSGSTVGQSEQHPRRSMADKYKLNPSPKRRYEVTLTIANAPGSFGWIKGFAQYEASDCVYRLDRFAGVSAAPDITLPISYKKVDETNYVGTIYLDAMQDENYFGESICHWVLTSARATLKATGIEREAGFSAYIDLEDFYSERPITTYLQRKFYPFDADIEDLSVFGQTDRSKMVTVKDEEIFTVTLIAKEVRS